MLIDEIVIVNLADEQNFLPEVSEWIWKEWAGKNGAKLDDVIYRSQHSISKDDIPQMYIAKIKDEVVGVVSLWRNDLTSRQDLFPWLAGMIVKKEYRNNGIGKKLQQKCIEEAKRLGYEYLYLITELDNYYEKMGWTFMEKAPMNNGEHVKIYSYKL